MSETQPYQLSQKLADAKERAKKNNCDIRVSIRMFHGTEDKTWQGNELQTMLKFWASRNSTSLPKPGDAPDEVLGDDYRFSLYKGIDSHNESLVEFIFVRDLPHGVDLHQPYIAWLFLSRFARQSDGTLIIEDEAHRATEGGGTMLHDFFVD